MTRLTRLLLLLSICLTLPAALAGPDFADGFSGIEIGGKWKLTGNVMLDEAKDRGGAGAALRIEPKGSATLELRDTDGSGTADFWVLDDLTSPRNAKARRGGPRWGLVQGDGRILVVGPIYAPYLSGNQTYATADYVPAKQERPWYSVQYLALRRLEGWHHWEFVLDAAQGMSIMVDDKPVTRFDWNRTKFNAFRGIVLLGDDEEADGQTLWVDDVNVTLGPPMKAKPTPPPPPPPVMPDQDPELEEPPVALAPGIAGTHPRLFFGPDDVPALREKALSPAMKEYWDDLMAYLPSCAPPADRKFLTDATDGQRQGLWRMPTLALHYLVTGDKTSFERAVGFLKMLQEMPHWESGKELDAGMSSANVMVGAAITFDWLYNDLEPEFREQFRRKLIYMARAQYHGGHLNKNKSIGYWQGDPANNHRWHRDAGLSLAVLTAFEGKPGEQWILNKTSEELAYVAEWLPADGTSHESPTYLTFGMPHLTLALEAADRCLGTRYLDEPFCRNVAAYKLQTLTPGFRNGFQFGDSSGVGGYNAFVWLYTAHHQLGDVQAGFDRLRANIPKAFEFGWWNILWRDPSLKGSADQLPTTSFYPDLGLAFVRDTWADDGVAAMFKCGPFGGYRLNAYRNENNFKYINVAHDDPDANSFMLWAQGNFLAESDRYSKHKRSANYNTILVDGKGQMVAGRPEGSGWTQPGSGDMTKLGVVTAWKQAPDVTIVEGEAAGYYAKLDRFRRTFIWVKGQYILVLDDIRAPDDVDITWLLQGPQVVAVDAPANAIKPTMGKTADSVAGLLEDDPIQLSAVNTYELRKDDAASPVALIADRPFIGAIGQSPADNRGEPLGWQQLQLRLRARTLRVVSLYNPWKKSDLTVKLATTSRDAATVTVTGAGINDTWQWTSATAQFAPSTLTGPVSLGPEDLPPQP